MLHIPKHIVKLTFALMLLCGSVLHAQTWQGDGSASNPWRIYTAEDLQALALFVNASQENADATSGMHFRIMNNIGLAEFLGTPADNPQGWEPIGRGLDVKGNRRYAFQGHLHGGGYVISGLRINKYCDTSNLSENFFIGLFGIIENATIDSLGVEVDPNDSVRGGNFTGILVGAAKWNSSIEQIYTKGKVSGQLFTGGLVGKLGNSYITNCYSTANVYGTSRHTGGLVGAMYFGGSLTYSYAAGTVEGYTAVGGLVGYVRFPGAIIHNVFVACDSIKGYPTAGRVIGYNFESETYLAKLYVSSSLVMEGRGGYYDGCEEVPLETLKNQSFFTNPANWEDSAWDFENVWTMRPNGFPVFRWQQIIPIIESFPPVLDTVILADGATIWPNFDSYVFEYEIFLPCMDMRAYPFINNFLFSFFAKTGDTIRANGQYGIEYLDYYFTIMEGNVYQLNVRVSNPNSNVTSTYYFTVRMPYDSSRIIKPYPNVLTVVNRPDLHGGKLFLDYQWFRDEQPIGENKGILYLGRNETTGNSRFWVKVIHEDGTESRICPISWDVDVHKLMVFPNPTDGHLTVVSEGQKTSRIEIFTIDGRLIEVINSTGIQTELDLNHLKPGTYIIRQNGQTAKFVKK